MTCLKLSWINNSYHIFKTNQYNNRLKAAVNLNGFGVWLNDKDIWPYFQPGTLSEVQTIANLWRILAGFKLAQNLSSTWVLSLTTKAIYLLSREANGQVPLVTMSFYPLLIRVSYGMTCKCNHFHQQEWKS